jgi:hypothetical protein
MIGNIGSISFSRPLSGPLSVKQTASPSPSNQSTYNPGISVLIGEYLGNLDDDNIMVRTNAARDLMVLAGSDIPAEQKIRMIYPLIMALNAILWRSSAEDLDFLKYAVQALSILSGLDLSHTLRTSLSHNLPRAEENLLELATETLVSADPAERSRAARIILALPHLALSRELKRDIVASLLTIFEDETLDLQSEAARSLAELATASLPEDLKARLIAPLLSAAEQPDYMLPDSAVYLLAELAEEEQPLDARIRMVPIFIGLLRSEKAEIRDTAAEALGYLAAADIPPELKISMIDPLLEVLGRTTALLFLGFGSVSEALINLAQSDLPDSEKNRMVQNLIEVFLHGAEELAQEEAALALVKLADTNIPLEARALLIDPLCSMLISDTPLPNIDAVWALARLASLALPDSLKSRMLEPVLNFYEANSFDDDCRQAAANALAQLASLNVPQEIRPRMIQPLIAAFEEFHCLPEYMLSMFPEAEEHICSSEVSAAQILISASEWELPESIKILLFEPLYDIYEREDLGLSSAAARALTGFRGLNLSRHQAILLVDPMLLAVTDSDPIWRREAAETLIWLSPNYGDISFIEPLLRIYEDTTINLENEAAFALTTLAATHLPTDEILRMRLVSPLAQTFRQGDQEMRNLAIRGLMELASSSLPPEVQLYLAPFFLEAFEDPNLNDLQSELARALTAFTDLPLPSEQRIRMVDPLVLAFNTAPSEDRIRAARGLISLASLNMLPEIKIKMLQILYITATMPVFGLEAESLTALTELAGLQLSEEIQTRLADLFIGALSEATPDLRTQLAWALVTIATSNPPAGLKDRIIDALFGTPENGAGRPWTFSRTSLVAELGNGFFGQGDYEGAAMAFSLIERDPVFSPLARTLQALSQSPEVFDISEVTLSGGLKIRSFRRTDEGGVDFHVFYTDESISTIVTGEAKLTWQSGDRRQSFTLGSRSRDLPANKINLEIYYSGTFGRVTFQNIDSSTTLEVNNILLDLSHRSGAEALPQQLFNGLNSTTVSTKTATELRYMGVYSSDTDSITLSYQSGVSTAVHELAHHWDLMVTQEGYQADVSRIFRMISWEGERRRDDDDLDFRGGIFSSCESRQCYTGPENSQMNLNRDRHPYGMENYKEDLATYAEDFFSDGRNLRIHVQMQMALGNFEPAVKYLFMRCFLYQGAEYGTSENSLSLGYREIMQALNSLDADSAANVRITTRRVLDEIRTAFALE